MKYKSLGSIPNKSIFIYSYVSRYTNLIKEKYNRYLLIANSWDFDKNAVTIWLQDDIYIPSHTIRVWIMLVLRRLLVRLHQSYFYPPLLSRIKCWPQNQSWFLNLSMPCSKLQWRLFRRVLLWKCIIWHRNFRRCRCRGYSLYWWWKHWCGVFISQSRPADLVTTCASLPQRLVRIKLKQCC